MVGHEVFISQMKDQIRIFQKQNRPIMTYFLSISEQNILQSMVPKNICLVFDGGYENAERSHVLYLKGMRALVIAFVYMPHTIQNLKH
mgnify:CR=1 FL=1